MEPLSVGREVYFRRLSMALETSCRPALTLLCFLGSLPAVTRQAGLVAIAPSNIRHSAKALTDCRAIKLSLSG
jgi:hypothetical protein